MAAMTFARYHLVVLDEFISAAIRHDRGETGPGSSGEPALTPARRRHRPQGA